MSNEQINPCLEQCPGNKYLGDFEQGDQCSGPNELSIRVREHGGLLVRTCVTRACHGDLGLIESAELQSNHVQEIIDQVQRLGPSASDPINGDYTGPACYKNEQFDVTIDNLQYDAIQGRQLSYFVFVRRADERYDVPKRDIVNRYEIFVNATDHTYLTVWCKENWLATTEEEYLLEGSRLTPERAREAVDILSLFEPADRITG